MNLKLSATESGPKRVPMMWKKAVSGAAAKAETGLIAAVGWMFPVSAGRMKRVTASQTESRGQQAGGLAARGGSCSKGD